MVAKDARINETEKQVAQVLGIGIYAYSDQRARRRIDSEDTSTYTQRRPHWKENVLVVSIGIEAASWIDKSVHREMTWIVSLVE
jgi:DNA-binding transcriptional regulator PaaX